MLLLSQELIEHIIDLLSDDRDALISCSYASRVFYHRTRMYLFSSVTFTQCGSFHDLSRARLLAEMPLAASQIKQAQVDHYATISTLFSSSLSSLVSLDLNYVRFSEPNDLHMAVLSLPLLKELNLKQCYFEEFESIIPRSPPDGPVLENLSILYTKASVLLDPLMSFRSVYMDSLVKLSLQNPYLDADLNQLIEYSRSARKLKILRLAWIDYAVIYTNPPTRLLHLTKLEELHVGITHQRFSADVGIMQWLMQSLLQPESSGLRRLMLRIFVQHDTAFSNDGGMWTSWPQIDNALPMTRIDVVWVCKGYKDEDMDRISHGMIALVRRQFPAAHERGMLAVTVCA
ncbi:uncharacterized protein BT62DRAFT_931482 [Guyanagaster necrorhizus]|uniref:Uncharacterized protein n=1 Tax=Guyanagaster necrorhizus TaxID=856835 RepID=A0A9P7VVG6_9AGAR|nr:uncharacterized protein BT62DRAFT_931482 [Guyanagaster necrorhizus MCA 3950]KAG7446909.1 hypothetical protein BT62DRAFT_931482 [Guyanagaster necrorhizus MCA 3950]